MDDYGYILMGIAAVVFVGGIVAFWAISRNTPKGTLLAVAVGLYVLSWAFASVRVREVVLITGLMRMLGVVGGILGLIDMFRKRPAKIVDAEVIEPHETDHRSN